MVNSKIKTKIKTKITTGNRPSAEARILLAARHVFMTKGMSGARMQDIADEAGINKALLHYYFKNKERLFDVIFRDASSVFFPKITGIIESTDTLEKKLEKFCCAYIDMMLQNPFLPLFVLTEANKRPAEFRKKFWRTREQVFQKFAEEISTEAEKKKELNINPAHLFLNMISMCIFPFIAKPIWQMSTGMNDKEFREFIDERKKIIPQLIIASLKKKCL